MARWLDLPYEIRNVNAEEDKLIKKCLTGYMRTFVKCGKAGYVMPGAFKKHAELIFNMEVRPDDIWVITFPRSGTTWTQELVWLVQNNLNYTAAREKALYKRFPMLETSSIIPEAAYGLIKFNIMNLKKFQGLGDAVKKSSWETINEMSSPRLIKTHLPLSLLPPKLLSTAKVIYVARDPRDVAVSYFYLHKMAAKCFMKNDFKKFWEAFRKDLLPYTPIVAHTSEAWMRRHEPNMHFIFYEDMIKDLPKEITKVCKFLNKQYTEGQIRQLADHLSFDSLRKSKAVNNTTKGNLQFVRKGEAGSWKAHFDKEMEIQAKNFLTDRLRGFDLKYPSFSSAKTSCNKNNRCISRNVNFVSERNSTYRDCMSSDEMFFTKF